VGLLLRYFLLACTPVLAFGALSWFLLSHGTVAELMESQRVWTAEEAELRAARIEAFFEARSSELRVMANSPTLREGDLATRLAYLREHEAQLAGRFEGLYWNDLEGFAIATDGRRYDVRDRFYQPRVTRGEPVLTSIITSRITGRQVVLAIVPVRAGGDGGPGRVGALGGTILVHTLLAEIEADDRRHGGIVALVDSDGTILARTGGDDLPLEAALEPLPDTTDFTPLRVGERELRVTTAPLEGSPGWSLALLYPREVLHAVPDQLRRTSLLLLAAVTGLAVLLAFTAHRTVVRPIHRLVDAQRRFGRGEHSARVAAAGPAEIAEIGRSFNQMAERVLAEAERRQEAERSLHGAQRLEAVGVLAGGVAHDFNNLLTVILGQLETLKVDAGPDVQEAVAEIERAARRAAELTAQLLGFARRQPSQPEPLEMVGFVESLRPMLRGVLPESVDLVLRLPEAPLPAYADPQQLEQVVLNLAVNGRDAMPEGGHLTIDLGTATARADGEDRVVLSVGDDGTGVSPEHLERVFDPFFSTKAPGRGTGLGLASAHGIVTQLGGEISVESALGHGTTFHVWLRPASQTSAARATGADAGPVEAPVDGARVLLVEDEPAVRRVLARMLERSGHVVVPTEDGHSALEMLRAGAAIQVLLTDLVMPGMGGVKLAEAARRMRPGLPVIFLSGYAEGSSAAPLPGQLLHKPVSAEDLDRAVRDALAKRRALSA
jgi:signal transduction histidine kinase/CheY-like chemotaxis protein